jgi:hypothetical protein
MRGRSTPPSYPDRRPWEKYGQRQIITVYSKSNLGVTLVRNSLETTTVSNCTGTKNKKLFIFKKAHYSKGRNRPGTRKIINEKCQCLHHILEILAIDFWLGIQRGLYCTTSSFKREEEAKTVVLIR